MGWLMAATASGDDGDRAGAWLWKTRLDDNVFVSQKRDRRRQHHDAFEHIAHHGCGAIDELLHVDSGVETGG
jgi:hypothetical protein